MTLFKQGENDKTSDIVHKIVECVLFLDGLVTGDYVYSMINEEIKPTLLEAYNVDYSRLFDMITNILELENIVIPLGGNYNNTSVKIKLTDESEITLKLKLANPIPQELVYFEHELLTLGRQGLYVRDFNGKPITNLIKITKLIKNNKLKALPISFNGFGVKDLFVKHVELNKALLKKKESGWIIINPDKLKVLKYSLYKEMYGHYEDVCSICVESFEDNNSVFITECKHIFHTTCWMRNINSFGGGSCPNCRGQVWENNISFTFLSSSNAIPATVNNILPATLPQVILPIPEDYNNDVD